MALPPSVTQILASLTGPARPAPSAPATAPRRRRRRRLPGIGTRLIASTALVMAGATATMVVAWSLSLVRLVDDARIVARESLHQAPPPLPPDAELRDLARFQAHLQRGQGRAAELWQARAQALVRAGAWDAAEASFVELERLQPRPWPSDLALDRVRCALHHDPSLAHRLLPTIPLEGLDASRKPLSLQLIRDLSQPLDGPGGGPPAPSP